MESIADLTVVADNGRTGIDESPAVSFQPAGNGMISSVTCVIIMYVLIIIS